MIVVRIFCVVMSIVVCCVLLTACMPASESGNVYSRDQARTAHSVYSGTVLRVEEVVIEGTQTGAGTAAGGLLGGALGNTIGSGSGRAVATAGGAVLGGLAGSAAEKSATTVVGLEMEVELDNGELILIVQEKDDEFRVGDRVRVIRDARGGARVRQ